MRNFSWRQVVSLLSLYLFIFMLVTGLVLYVAPPTRVANVLSWTFFGLLKSDYVRVHTIISLCFLIVGCWHIWFNWAAIKQYFGFKMYGTWKNELLLAMIITILVTAVALTNSWPATAVMEAGHNLKESWGGPGGGGTGKGFRHFSGANVTLVVWAAENHKEVHDLVEKLARKGWKAKGKQTIGDIAEQNGVSKEEILQELR